MSYSPSPELFDTFIRDFITSHARAIFAAFPPPLDQITDPQPLIFTVYSNLLPDPVKQGPLPASKAAIEALPTVTVTEEEEECAICLTEIGLREEGVIKEMPCKHRYHGECIMKWLGVCGTCPVCRYEMPVDEEEEEKGRREGGVGWQVTVMVDRRGGGGEVNESGSVEDMDVDLDSGGGGDDWGQGSMEDLD